ncbi:hypothetical protein HII31_08973 [Pseudocercospora fuligena]|uniref:RBR-type E3 ubiquitin transferase n=1 Tax=Pseudocercospora fuligena TaxID=685502 RepID=A0A8H6RET8_9PEZI|nr:hypothetical protein HII31_08973 [Pseudocercospora fuligena]
MDTLTNLFKAFTVSKKPPGSSNLDAQPQPIECAACFDECTDKNIQVAGDHLCYDCFETGYVPQFHEALKDESKYPVKYGTTTLHPSHYRNFFDHNFRVEWRKKKAEYKTPVKQRIYCNNLHDGERCGKFLGSSNTHLTSVVTCKSCKGNTCIRCSQPYSSSSDHECPASEEDEAFKDLERGVDFQICPISTCQVKISLQDGCNGVRCAICKTEFCFICGQKSELGHWNSGMPCPRFGKKGDQRAIFDTPIAAPGLADGPDFDEEANDREIERLEAALAIIDTMLQDFAPIRLHEIDRRILRTLHTRVRGIFFGGRAVRNVHDLIHALQSGIGIYVRQDQDSPWRVEENARIRALVAEVDFTEWPLLREIVDSYNLAWEGRMEELRQIVR